MSKVFSRNEGGTDSPPPVYTIGPPAYVAPPEYINNETVVVGDCPAWAPGSTTGQMRKEQLPPSYQQLFPSTLGAPLPPIEIVPTHAIQQHVPYGYYVLCNFYGNKGCTTQPKKICRLNFKLQHSVVNCLFDSFFR